MINGTVNQLHDTGLTSRDAIIRKVGNRMRFFWKDQWIGDIPLMVRFPRLLDWRLIKIVVLIKDGMWLIGIGTGLA